MRDTTAVTKARFLKVSECFPRKLCCTQREAWACHSLPS
jgi:hypothetical protein